MFLLKALCLMCLSWKTAMGIPTLKIEPTESNVVEGDTVVFTCTVTGRDKENGDILWQGWSGGSFWSYSATSMRVSVDYYGFLENVNFKNHTVYNANYEEEVFELYITNITKTDDKLPIYCGYSSSVRETAYLFVWRKPQCKVEGDIPIIIDDGESYPVTLTCTLEDGDLPPALTWYKMEQNNSLKIAGPTRYSVSTSLSINASNYGREYTCQARIDAIPDLPLTCTVVPYQPQLVISVSLILPEYGDSTTISIICHNTGAAKSDISYIWYIEGTILSETQDGSVSISQAVSDSTIVLAKSFLPSGSVEITCEGVIPMSVRANASVVITVESDNKSAGALTTSAGLKALIAVAVIGWCSFIMVILIYCLKHKFVSSEPEPPSVDKDGYTYPPIS